MNTRSPAIALLFFSLFSWGSLSSVASSAEYEALKDVKAAKAIFDVRVGAPKSAALHMDLIHQTYKTLQADKKNPDFVVVFLGPSVKLFTKSRAGFAPDDHKYLDGIANTVSQMKKEGIKFELCGVAAKLFEVDPASVLPEIKVVENGWLSEIGYQIHGYSLVPAY